jgi:DNA repair protein RadA/Sms
MARPSTIHVCTSCGHGEARWHGQCPGCGEWNTLVEERAPVVRAGGGG